MRTLAACESGMHWVFGSLQALTGPVIGEPVPALLPTRAYDIAEPSLIVDHEHPV